MKIVSQTTTALSSATAPGNNQPQLVATPVPDEQRISFWPQHFGLIPQWVTLEQMWIRDSLLTLENYQDSPSNSLECYA